MLSKADWIKQVVAVGGGAAVDTRAEDAAKQDAAEKLYNQLKSAVLPNLKAAMKMPTVAKQIEGGLTAAMGFAGRGSFVEALQTLKHAAWQAKDAIAAAGKNNLNTIAKKDEYIDEDKKVGWRAPDNRPEDRERTSAVTRYENTPEAQQASEAKANDLGQLVDMNGKPVDGSLGYVINPKSGEMHTFDAVHVEWEFADGHVAKIIGHRKTQEVEDLIGIHGAVKQRRIPHHTTPLAGGKVSGAGNVTMQDGHIKKIDNVSGHYKPDLDTTDRAIRSLDKKGALVDRTIIDAEGRELKVDPAASQEEQDRVKAALKEGQLINKLEEQIAQWEREGKRDATYDKAIKKRNEMQSAFFKKGFSAKNSEAEVSLIQGISPAEWETVKGDSAGIAALVNKKFGLALAADYFVSVAHNSGGVMATIAEQIAVKSKRSAFIGAEGNVDQLGKKNRTLKDIQAKGGWSAWEQSNKADTAAQREFNEFGGIEKLKSMGVDPAGLKWGEAVKLLKGELPASYWAQLQAKRLGDEYTELGGDAEVRREGLSAAAVGVLTLNEKLLFLNKKLSASQITGLANMRLGIPAVAPASAPPDDEPALDFAPGPSDGSVPARPATAYSDANLERVADDRVVVRSPGYTAYSQPNLRADGSGGESVADEDEDENAPLAFNPRAPQASGPASSGSGASPERPPTAYSVYQTKDGEIFDSGSSNENESTPIETEAESAPSRTTPSATDSSSVDPMYVSTIELEGAEAESSASRTS